jgi:hypothetical protein
MAKLTIGGRTFTVDDSFLGMSPDRQQAVVDETASSLGRSDPAPRRVQFDERFGDGPMASRYAIAPREQVQFDERFGDGPMASEYPIAAGERTLSDLVTGRGGMTPMQAGLQQFAEAENPRFRGQQQARREGGYLDAIPRALTTGGVGNLPDYGPAFVEGMKGIFDGRGFSHALDEELEVHRGQREGLAEKFPMTTLAGNVAGAIAPAVRTAGLASGPNLLVRGAKSALIGAPVGFVQSWAQGEGAGDQWDKGVEGAAWGAALGKDGHRSSCNRPEPVRV